MNVVTIFLMLIGAVFSVGCGSGDDSGQSSSSLSSFSSFSLSSYSSSSLLFREDGAYKLDIPLSGSLQNPAFIDNDSKIIFTRFREGYNEEYSDIYMYDLTSGALKLLVSNESANVNLPGAIYDEESDTLVFSSSREPHDEIYALSLFNAEAEKKITQRKNYVAYEPTISYDGNYIAFESHKLDVEDAGRIVSYTLDASQEYNYLTPKGEDARQPNFAPQESMILYQKFENSQWDIWIMRGDGSEKIRVTQGEGDKTDAVFSYDAKSIIYSSDASLELANIYRISISTHKITRLTNFSGYDGAVSISKDSHTIVFESSEHRPEESGTSIFIKEIQ